MDWILKENMIMMTEKKIFVKIKIKNYRAEF
jgi:hypothetical protein